MSDYAISSEALEAAAAVIREGLYHAPAAIWVEKAIQAAFAAEGFEAERNDNWITERQGKRITKTEQRLVGPWHEQAQ